MEVSKVSVGRQIEQKSSISNRKLGKEFAEEFGSASKREKDSQMSKLLESIKKKGRQIIDSKSINAVHEYKSYIKEYLSYVLKDAYRVDHLRSTFSGNLSTLVSIINEELDKLTQSILAQEKDTIVLVNSIEHIEGLLVDIYK